MQPLPNKFYIIDKPETPTLKNDQNVINLSTL